jgi:hypothetical protein
MSPKLARVGHVSPLPGGRLSKDKPTVHARHCATVSRQQRTLAFSLALARGFFFATLGVGILGDRITVSIRSSPLLELANAGNPSTSCSS